ncbi:MAG: GntR family transcriptional regulator [Victivallales bacterium]|nr:GntR family transcriptional regulator [Victivallales bacterium]
MASRTEITQERIINYIATQRIPVGGRLPPEKTVAALCGVSMITARRALADLEANNVITRIHGRGTFVKLDLQATPSLGKLLFISIGKTSEGRHSKIFDAVEQKSLQRGCRLDFIKVGSSPETSVMEKLDTCKGIILYGWVNAEWVDYIAGLGIPAVAVSSDDFNGRIRVVSYDYGKITRQILDQLFALGAKNIGMPIWSGSQYPQDKLRLTAYRNFMVSHDLIQREENLLSKQADPVHYYQIIGDFLSKRQHPLDAIILPGTDIYINMLNFLLENPHVKHPLIGVSLLNHATYQLEHAMLSRTVCAIPEHEISEILVETLFNSRAKTTRISTHLLYKGKTVA